MIGTISMNSAIPAPTIKLGARDRAQLVVFAYQAGLVAPRSAGQMPGR
jgi:hypothetical protein